ncbi:MAG: hypothetical protein ACN6N0_13390, partial [Microvirgula sp.]
TYKARNKRSGIKDLASHCGMERQIWHGHAGHSGIPFYNRFMIYERMPPRHPKSFPSMRGRHGHAS